MTKLVRVLLTVAGVLTALSAVGFDITLLSVFGGALGVGLGFGLRSAPGSNGQPQWFAPAALATVDDELPPRRARAGPSAGDAFGA